MRVIRHAQVERLLLLLPLKLPFVLFRFGVERLSRWEWSIEGSTPLSLLPTIDRLMAQYQPLEEPC